MNLVSLSFILFFSGLLILYYLIPKKFQWVSLLVGSYVFYAYSSFNTLIFIIITTISTFYLARKISDIENNKNHLYNNNLTKRENKKILKRRKRKFLLFSLILNFGILAILKYYPLFNEIIKLFGFNDFFIDFGLVIPLGISFYTFQTTGYLIDVYKGKVEAEDNIFRFSLFTIYFPQLIQGPISRYKDLQPQFYTYKYFNYEKLISGLQLVLWGLFKIYMIADRAAVLVDTVFDNFPNNQGALLVIAIVIYSLQIFANFSGGIDMIRGISEILQIDLIDNFNQPFFAISISDFWKRWHISLGNWLREYVFYNIALSKRIGKLNKKLKPIIGDFFYKQLPVAIASFAVFLLIGIWHGPNFKYIAYGIYQALFVVFEPILYPFFEKLFKISKFNKDTFSFKIFRILRTNMIIAFGRFFFRADTFKNALSMQKSVIAIKSPYIYFSNFFSGLGLNKKELLILTISIILLLIVEILHENKIKIRQFIQEQNLIFRWILYYTIIFMILIFGYYGPSIGSSDFIYRGF